MIGYVYDDGGREAAGFKGQTSDCVTRAVAIGTGLDYQEVYDELHERARVFGATRRSARARQAARNPSPRTGVHREVYEPYLFDLGWIWHPTMAIGQGCTTHLRADELPDGRIIVAVSRHLTAVVYGVVHDTHDPSREGTRCVYGWYESTCSTLG